MNTLRMIVGLGNPGPTYAGNRHNIGFQVVDRIAARHRIDLGRTQANARLGDGWVQRRGSVLDMFSGGLPAFDRQKVILVKPLTYMNNSGQSVSQLARFYQIDPADILVIHDHMDLEAGKLRLRPGGGSGGNNGIKSIARLMGTEDFPRVRVGVGRPPGRMDPAAYVLQDFSAAEEADIFGPLREIIGDAVECWLFEGIEAAMNKYNG